MTAQPGSEQEAPTVALDALSVVIPVFNEPDWIRTCVEAVCAAGDAAGLPLEVIIVNDGSTDRTPEVLAELAATRGIQVHSQANAGRLAARSAGVARARSPWILLLDSRVVVAPDALRWVREQIAEHPQRRVWNGHVEVETRGNLFAAFWSGITKLGWRRYFANPRLASFGTEEFDAYPKGTTGLLIPRELLANAVGEFTSLFDVANLASDDTRLLRDVAARERIWIAPGFAFRYHGKTGVRKFFRQAYFRGTTFIDSYLGTPGAVRRLLIAAIVAAVAVAALLVLAPLVGLAIIVAVILAVPVAVRLLGGGTWVEAGAGALLTPLFIPVFGVGIVRGLLLASARRLRLSARRG